MPRFPYHFFNNFIVRTPTFSCKDFLEAGDKEFSEQKLKEIYNQPFFREATYLASPYLSEQLNKWLSGKEIFGKDQQKLKRTFLKYYSRISTRSTPFGLFSSVGLGNFDWVNDKFSITNGDFQSSTDNQLRDTKLDMHFLVSLAKKLESIPSIKDRLQYFPNNSIYTVGKNIRYVEYESTDGKRDYIISSAPFSEELQQVLNFSKDGKTIDEIAGTLANNEITKEEAEEFIIELIDNQVLVSELEPNVSGNDFFENIINVLKNRGAEKEPGVLCSIQDHLEKLDQNIGNPVSKYAEIEALIKSLSISFGEDNFEYDQKYLFQTDLYSEHTFTLSPHWKKELKKGISFLNKISLQPKDSHLESFKKAFYERFETQEVPLALALDTEIGIGYRQDNPAIGIHHYLEDLDLPSSHKKNGLNIQLNAFHQILNERLQETLLKDFGSAQCDDTIQLLDEDFKDFEENWTDLPDTMSFMTEIVSDAKLEKLVLEGGGGNSAANLLGRFCSEKSEVQKLTKEIAEKEKTLREIQHENSTILAEIVHLPEARIGNVIRRPTLRKYEIPYLAQSVLPKENQIPIDDLHISLQQDRIVLRSRRLNKEVKPYLTNAHNYYNNSLPVYQFLCDLHSQNIRSGLYFSWGDLQRIYKFMPRVEYQNIILSKAQWKVDEKDVSYLKTLTQNKEKLLSELQMWREKRKIPAWIQCIQSDNKLTLNLENYDFANIFMDTILKQKSIIIEEFLYNENDNFKREFIFPMYRGE